MADDIKKINDEINRLRTELGKNPLKPFDEGDLQRAKALLSGLRAEIREMSSDLDYVAKAFKDSVNELSNQKTYLSDAKKSLNGISSIAQKITDYRRGESTLTEKQLKDLQNQARVRFEELETIKKVGNLSKENRAELIQALKEQEKFNNSIERTIEHQKDVNKEIGLLGVGIGGVAKAAAKLGFGDLSQPLTEAVEKTKNARLQMKLNNDQISEVNQQLTTQNARQLSAAQLRAGFGGKELKLLQLKADSLEEHNKSLATQTSKYRNIGASLKEQLTTANLVDFAIKEMVDALISGDKATGELAKGFNMSYSAASELRSELNTVANLTADVNVNTKGLQESMMAVGRTLGSNAKLNKEDLITFTKLREQSGMTNENLASMQRFTLATGGTLEETTGEFLAQAQITAQNNGVVLNTKQLLEETANTSDAIKLSAGGTATSFAKAAATVKALGMNLQQVDAISESLLNFESSITSELEAELLTGKDLTLEKARQAALNGDLVTVGEEISRQIGDSAQFTKMNRLQQEALAKSVGMSRDDLAKTLVEREALVGLSGEEAKAGKEAFDALVKKYDVETATKMIREKGFKTLMDQQSVQERFNKGIEKLRDLFIGLAQPILSVVSPLIDLVNNILPLINVILTPVLYTVQFLGEGIGKVVGFLTQAQDVAGVLAGTFGAILAFQNRSNIATAAGIVLDKTRALFAKKEANQSLASAALGAIKSVVQTPIIGPLLAAAAAAGVYALGKSYLSKGDDVVSPGYGKRTLMSPEGAIALNDKDTVIAGTDLGKGKNNVEQQPSMPSIDLTPMIAELQAVKAVLQQILAKEGAVYIDSTKAGTAFTMGTSKLQ